MHCPGLVRFCGFQRCSPDSPVIHGAPGVGAPPRGGIFAKSNSRQLSELAAADISPEFRAQPPGFGDGPGGSLPNLALGVAEAAVMCHSALATTGRDALARPAVEQPGAFTRAFEPLSSGSRLRDMTVGI